MLRNVMLILAISVAFFMCCSQLRAAQIVGSFTDELDAESYDCLVSLHTETTLATDKIATLTLEQNVKDGIVITISSKAISISATANPTVSQSKALTTLFQPGQAIHLAILRRKRRLLLFWEKQRLFDLDIPRTTGAAGSIALAPGCTLVDACVQRIEPVYFTDDFMRTTDDFGVWQKQQGEWALHSAWDEDPHGNSKRFSAAEHALNAFSLSGKAAIGSALCSTGWPFWEDYTFTAAVLPPGEGAVGLVVNMVDAGNGILLRWSPVNDRGASGNRLILYRLENGVQTKLAETVGGFIPGIWYKMSITTSWGDVRVVIDDEPRLELHDVTPFRGGIGLYVEGKHPALFDDVTVYGSSIAKDYLLAHKMKSLNEKFANDLNGMQSWVNVDGWKLLVALPAYWTSRAEFNIEQSITLTSTANDTSSGEVWLTLNGDGTKTTSGYRVVIQQQSDTQASYAFYRDAVLLKTLEGTALLPDTVSTFSFARHGNMLRFDENGTEIYSWRDDDVLTGTHPGYRATGIFGDKPDVVVLDGHLIDYIFSTAPVDWLPAGTWMSTVRWSCEPSWSFLCGWSRGEAVLWHKKRFTGNHSIQAFVGVKMEYPGEREIYDDRYRDFCVTLCGDGWDPRTGYSAIFGADDGQGGHNSVVLLRDGIRVASVPMQMPTRATSHRQWLSLLLNKVGNTIEFSLDGKVCLRYTDPQPIDGGIPALWTMDNSICIARVRLRYDTPPLPRQFSTVNIAGPSLPVWVNVGQPLTIPLANLWSSSGKPVSLHLTPRQTPPNVVGALLTKGSDLTFTPTIAGDYWYQVYATDAQQRSRNIDIALPVFAPAAGRDDSHALAFYRFDEGKGRLVHDSSNMLPHADLQMSDNAAFTWLAGQGLRCDGAGKLTSLVAADKLLALQKSTNFSLECWLSLDTLYPSMDWTGCLLCWGKGDTQNFSLGFHGGNLVALDQPALGWEATSAKQFAGLLTSFQHLVLTYDGVVTRMYLNGKLAGESHSVWQLPAWTAGNPLTIASQCNGKFPMQGTCYLLAIHDKALTPEEVARHYQAGPSAR